MQEISLCMIVKNEEKNLKNCLESVKNLVDEIIIVDTGSTDKTKEIASNFTNKIFDFNWCDDFSKARNFSISKASKPWILFIDADESISEKDLEKIKELTNTGYDAFMFDIRTYTNERNVAGWISSKYDSYSESKIATGFWVNSALRLFKNKKGYYFEGRIHESPKIPILNAKGRVLDTGIVINHFGALKDNFATKKENYIELLKKRIRERDFSKRSENLICRELASELIQLKKPKEALRYLKRAIEIQETPIDLINLGATYLYLKQLDKAEKIFTKANTIVPNQPDININLGIVYLRKKNYNKAIKRFERALKINPSSASAYFHLGLTYKRKGKISKAKEFFEKAIEFNPKYRKKITSLLYK
jgi:glycosyltransferase involved in cell wall biosynthesis